MKRIITALALAVVATAALAATEADEDAGKCAVLVAVASGGDTAAVGEVLAQADNRARAMAYGRWYKKMWDQLTDSGEKKKELDWVVIGRHACNKLNVDLDQYRH